MNRGTLVRMSAALKAKMRAGCAPGKHVAEVIDGADDTCFACSLGHVLEFGESVGVVQGPVDYNNVPADDPRYDPHKVGPGVDVRWLPDMLRYGYAVEDLEEVHVSASQITFLVSAEQLHEKDWVGTIDGKSLPAYGRDAATAMRHAVASQLRDIASQLALGQLKFSAQTLQITFIPRAP